MTSNRKEEAHEQSQDTYGDGSSAALILRPTWSWAQTPTEPDKYDWERHMSHMMWDGGWFGMIFGPLFMILALAAVIAVVVTSRPLD